MSFPSQKLIASIWRLVPAVLVCGLLACSAGGPSALTGGGSAVGDTSTMAAPTQPSGAASPHVDAGDEKDLMVRLEGSYPIAVANLIQNANSEQVEITLQGHVMCAGHPQYGCRSGRILRMFFKHDNQFVEGLLSKDPEGNEEGYFEFKFYVAKQELNDPNSALGANLWQFSLAPSDYNATMLREKQDCPSELDSCRGSDWTALFFAWETPLTQPNIPSNPMPPQNLPISF